MTWTVGLEQKGLQGAERTLEQEQEVDPRWSKWIGGKKYY